MRRRIIIMCVMLAVAMSVVAASRSSKKQNGVDKRQYITLWGGVGYSSMPHTIDGTNVPGGVGAEFGAGYEFDYRKLLFHTGLEVQYLSSTMRFASPLQADADFKYVPAGTTMTYHYRFPSWKDRQQAFLLNIPIMVGGRFADYWYAMGGVRVGVSLAHNARANADCDVTYSDEQMIGEMSDAHYAGSYMLTSSEKLAMGINVAPSAEIGLYLDRWVFPEKQEQAKGKQRGKKQSKYLPPSCRIAVFAECNALNFNRNHAGHGFLAAEQMSKPDDIQVHTLFNSDIASGKAVHNYIVGAKFTYMFSLTKAPKRGRGRTTKTTKTTKPTTPPPTEITPEPVTEPEDTIRLGDIVVEKEQPVILQNLLFEFRTAIIIPESTQWLSALAEMLQKHESVQIHLIGHTDAVGSTSFNQRLSLQRAEAVKTYLIQQGIEAERITTEGRGATEPIDTNETEAGRQNNRRVEFVITDADE